MSLLLCAEDVSVTSTAAHTCPWTAVSQAVKETSSVTPGCEINQGDQETAHHRYPLTIVTSLLNLHREKWRYFSRDLSIYLRYAENLLKLDLPMILFVDESVTNFIHKWRVGKEHITQVVSTNLSSLNLYKKYYKQVQQIMSSQEFKRNHSLLLHPEGFSPEYNILMNSKLSLLYDASVNNSFNSKYFFWIDIGYGHGAGDIFPNNPHWLPRNLMTYSDKITYIELNPIKYLRTIHDIYKQQMPPFLNGGFFGGSLKAVQEYYWLHQDMWHLFLQHGMVDDDQTLAVLCYFAKTSLFNLVKGWWYDAFHLFK